MFDSLLGRKFTVRCKQAIKCINVRLKVIRKRKQAMLNFLRQDIADLLRDGHDSNALNRMDALIVEINHLACYDMIQKFCESILKHISLLQKQRKCPAEETKEAVSTLIFAAARFSDLPELCDLRHTFMSRYGSAMETSASLEFIEKLASRTFPMATKIHLMQKIAQEFSVEWVSERLEYDSSGSVASQCANEKNDGMCQAPINTVKDVVADDPKYILAIGLEPEPKRRSKICDGELENVNPYPPDTSIPHYVHPKRDKDGGYTSPRAREVLDQIDQEGKVLDGSKVHSRSSRAHGKLESGSDDTRKQAAREDEFEDNVKPVKIPPYLKSKAVRDALHSDDWDKDEIPKENSGKAEKYADLAAGKRQMDDDRPFHMTPPPYLKVKPKVTSATADHSDSSSAPNGAFAARNKSSNVGNGDPRRDEVVVGHERPKPRSVRRNKKSPFAQESDDAVGSDEPMRGELHHGQRRHVARKNTFPHQDGRDSEEEDIDRLLTHYSEKKTPQQSIKYREKPDARPADHARDRCGVDQHQTSEEHNDNKLESPRTRFVEHVAGDKAVICRQYIDMRDSTGKSARSLSAEQMNRGESGRRLMYHRHHADKPELVLPCERAVPFPPDPLAVGKVEGPARVASMQPDALSPSGGHAHPNLPDYEVFAARFAALRRG